MLRAAHIFYSGRVQGVGFRYTAERLANNFGLTGWVRNLRDGRVELFCEGEQEDINGFMRMIESHFQGYIRAKELDWSQACGKFDYFDIAF
jgi:acylphosphatase